MLLLGGKEIPLLPGDLFVVRSPGLLGWLIRAITWIWSRDNTVGYNHAGIFLSDKGQTFEALWKIGTHHVSDYTGRRMLVARADAISLADRETTLKRLIVRYSGCQYPAWRILMHIIPPLAKISFFKIPVCSELTAIYCWWLGVRHKQWAGTSPETMEYEWVHWRAYTVLGEGVVEWADKKT